MHVLPEKYGLGPFPYPLETSWTGCYPTSPMDIDSPISNCFSPMDIDEPKLLHQDDVGDRFHSSSTELATQDTLEALELVNEDSQPLLRANEKRSGVVKKKAWRCGHLTIKSDKIERIVSDSRTVHATEDPARLQAELVRRKAEPKSVRGLRGQRGRYVWSLLMIVGRHDVEKVINLIVIPFVFRPQRLCQQEKTDGCKWGWASAVRHLEYPTVWVHGRIIQEQQSIHELPTTVKTIPRIYYEPVNLSSVKNKLKASQYKKSVCLQRHWYTDIIPDNEYSEQPTPPSFSISSIRQLNLYRPKGLHHSIERINLHSEHPKSTIEEIGKAIKLPQESAGRRDKAHSSQRGRRRTERLKKTPYFQIVQNVNPPQCPKEGFKPSERSIKVSIENITTIGTSGQCCA
ncbi:hypothetical protein R3P38DRAFT_2786678 [Favolaschia claudopus]|uniref:Uncharacterized protein n=1 Tax=Favolaschia claudopus TaxID=2862362 RepID=A0AAW0ARV1_9AGAR